MLHAQPDEDNKASLPSKDHRHFDLRWQRGFLYLFLGGIDQTPICEFYLYRWGYFRSGPRPDSVLDLLMQYHRVDIE